MQVDILAVGISCAASVLCAAYAVYVGSKADKWVGQEKQRREVVTRAYERARADLGHWQTRYFELLDRAYLRDEKGRIAKARDVLK